MAISHFNMTSSGADDVIALAPFSDFTFGKDTAKVSTAGRYHHSPPTTSEGSPDSSAIIALADGAVDEDDEDNEDNSEDGDITTKKRSGGSAASASAKRGKANSAERRATHNAIERARRESLNGRFLELAGALPTMANVKRPSKSIIVNKSLEWIYESQIREHALVRENNALRAELNEMRARLQMPLLPTTTSVPASGAQEYGSVKGPVSAQPQNGTLPYNGPVASMMGITADGYFGSAPNYGSLAALHNPGHFPAFAAHAAAPPSAPANMLAFSNPFQAFEGFAEQAGYGGGSPGSRSESGSEAASAIAPGTDIKEGPAHAAGVPGPGFGSPHSISSSGAESVVPTSAGIDKVPPLAPDFASLQAAYSQQQQYATLAAISTAHQPANPNWALMF